MYGVIAIVCMGKDGMYGDECGVGSRMGGWGCMGGVGEGMYGKW